MTILSGTTENSKGPVGIGGWLFLPIAVLIFTIYGALADFQQTTMVLLGPELWEEFKTPGTIFYHSPWVAMMTISGIIQICILLCSISALVAIFLKKKIVPKLMIGVYVLALCLVSVDMAVTFIFISKINPELASQMTPELFRKAVGVVAGAIILIPYFIMSRRVKNTFTN